MPAAGRRAALCGKEFQIRSSDTKEDWGSPRRLSTFYTVWSIPRQNWPSYHRFSHYLLVESSVEER